VVKINMTTTKQDTGKCVMLTAEVLEAVLEYVIQPLTNRDASTPIPTARKVIRCGSEWSDGSFAGSAIWFFPW
jgi:hypothetical protein